MILLWSVVVGLVLWNLYLQFKKVIEIDNLRNYLTEYITSNENWKLRLMEERTLNGFYPTVSKINDFEQFKHYKELAQIIFENDDTITANSIDNTKTDTLKQLVYLNSHLINILLKKEYERKG